MLRNNVSMTVFRNNDINDGFNSRVVTCDKVFNWEDNEIWGLFRPLYTCPQSIIWEPLPNHGFSVYVPRRPDFLSYSVYAKMEIEPQTTDEVQKNNIKQRITPSPKTFKHRL
jgi:hypothetical protein